MKQRETTVKIPKKNHVDLSNCSEWCFNWCLNRATLSGRAFHKLQVMPDHQATVSKTNKIKPAMWYMRTLYRTLIFWKWTIKTHFYGLKKMKTELKWNKPCHRLKRTHNLFKKRPKICLSMCICKVKLYDNSLISAVLAVLVPPAWVLCKQSHDALWRTGELRNIRPLSSSPWLL